MTAVTPVPAAPVAESGPTLPKAGPAEPGLDYRRLQSLGLEHVRRLSRRIWTDYNVHDPGYTAIELASYALTDLTSRAQWPVEDLLASTAGGPVPPEPLFSARTILPGRPLTALDYRKLFIDLPKVKNAWIVPADESVFTNQATGTVTRERPAGPGIREVRLGGLYRVLLEFMPDVTEPADRAAIIAAATARYHAHRNLCEDLVEVAGVTQQLFRLCGEVELAPDADAAAVKAEILFRVQRYLAPPVWNYSLSEMLERIHRDGSRYTVEEIFGGPALETGFYDDEELAEADLRTEIRLSDVIALAMGVPGVRAVRELLLQPVRQTEPAAVAWIVPVSPGRQPVLIDMLPDASREDEDKGKPGSRLVFYKRHLPIVPPDGPAAEALATLIAAERSWLEGSHADDLPIPPGRDRHPERHYPFQLHFPAVYGIGPDGLSLDGIADAAARTRRQAQALQLKGYLLFLDQLMANFCAQLSRVRQLFSADPTLRRSYVAQAVREADLPGAETLYVPAMADVETEVTQLLETDAEGAARRNLFLNHLIARFAERFHEYAAIMQSVFGADPAGLIDPKCAFLKAYPEISAERGLAYDYTLRDPAAIWDSDNVSGLERRLARLLDLRTAARRNLSDVGLDQFAQVVPDGAEFVWQVTDRGAPPAVLLRSRGKFATEALAREALLDALRRGQQRGHYEIKVAADGRPFFNLTGEGGGVLATQFHPSTAECDAAIRRLLAHLTHWYGEEGMYLVEHILLRMNQPGDPPLPVCPDPGCSDCPGDDPYSWRLHVVLPAYAGRFATMAFRRFVEDVIREETPAHLLPKICWIGRDDMRRLERAYRDWLGIRSGETAADRTAKLQRFIDTLYDVKNVYPAGVIKACVRGEDPGRFQLGRSALGTMPPRDD